MSESPKQTWRIEIGKFGDRCKIYCNGEWLKEISSADLHLGAGERSTLRLRIPIYARSNFTDPTLITFDDDVISVAEGMPFRTEIEIGEKRFRLVEIIPEEERDNRLFG